MNIKRGYEPVKQLDTNIMASRNALIKMGFPITEVNKIDIVTKARKYFVKRSQELTKLSKKGKLGSENGISSLSELITCDICKNNTGLGIAELTSIEQEDKIPSDYSLVRLGSLKDGTYRAYMIVSLGVVIDYGKTKIYVICGNCQLMLGLRATKSGLLINKIVEETGYGFVDLDEIEKLIQNYQE